MKNILFLFAIVALLFTACTGGNKSKTHFGENINAKGAIESSELVSTLGSNDSLAMKVRGPVNAACQAKGCWMTMDLGGEQEMRVRFKDYGFFVPKDAAGKTAVVEGWAHREEISVDMLRHYAEDGGADSEEIAAITEPEVQITFMANGVILKDSK